MKKILATLLLLASTTAIAQWSNGSNLWPTPPIGIGSQAHNSIAFGVRCLTYTDPCNSLTGAGQRGISSEAYYNSQATVYVAGIHSALAFAPGTYTVPNAYRIRAVEEPPLPAGVVLSNLYGLYVFDVNKGQNNWAIYTNDGPSSFGDPITIRRGALTVTGQPGYRSINVENGGIISLYDGTNTEIGRIQASGGDVIWTVLSGKLNINGNVKITGLAGSGTRAVYAQSDGSLIAP